MNKPKYYNKKNFQYFSYFYSHLKHRVIISLFLSLAVGVLDGLGLAMFLPLLQMVEGSNSSVDADQLGNLSFIVDGLEAMGVKLNLTSVLVVMLVFFSLKGIMKFAELYLKVVYQQFFMRNIRVTNIDLLSSFSYNNFVSADSGKIQNTFSGEVGRVNQAYRSYFTAIQYGVLVMVYISLAFLANPRFAILVAIGGFLTNIVFKKLYKTTKKLSKRLTSESHEFQGLLIQKVTFFKYLKASGLIYSYAGKLKKNINQIESSQRKIGTLNATLQAIREPLVIFVVVVVILIQVKVFSEGLGLIILSLLFFYRSLTFVMAMQNYWNDFLSMSGSLDNMTDFTNELIAGKEVTGEVNFESFKNRIDVNSLSFSYPDATILNDLNFSIYKNETIAIVGESGSGKTTLINILSGLLKSSSGTIAIDGRDINDLKISTFQKRIGYITQEPVIFNDTIFNNVTFWADKTAENLRKFEEALKKAAIYSFVMEQPKQEDALLGNSGVNISGGQKQRLSIARELYKEVDFLFMDEATSALDSETERAIQENIDKLKGEFTIIIIAHRLSTIRNANRILYLNKGSVEYIGDFDSLKSNSTNFRRMVEFQKF